MSALAGSFGDIDIGELNGGANTLVTFDGAGAGAGNKIILHDVVASSSSEKEGVPCPEP